MGAKVVILMLENRSFDHMFGFLTGQLNGTEFNRVNSSDPNSAKVVLQRNPPYVLQCDPGTPIHHTPHPSIHREALKGLVFVSFFSLWHYAMLDHGLPATTAKIFGASFEDKYGE